MFAYREAALRGAATSTGTIEHAVGLRGFSRSDLETDEGRIFERLAGTERQHRLDSDSPAHRWRGLPYSGSHKGSHRKEAEGATAET